jgi:hypothetical protein
MLIIKIVNDGTGTVEVGNYRYQVLVNDTVIESGEIKSYHRQHGWRSLVKKVIEKSWENEAREYYELIEREPKWCLPDRNNLRDE